MNSAVHSHVDVAGACAAPAAEPCQRVWRQPDCHVLYHSTLRPFEPKRDRPRVAALHFEVDPAEDLF